MNTNIEISHITKKYKNGVTALDDVSFRVGSGVFGLLGHNGAGKTTLMKALVTVLTPISSTIRICGFDTVKQGNEVQSKSWIFATGNLPCTPLFLYLTL